MAVQGTESTSSNSGFLSEILTPGSSLNPSFLLALDGAFSLLLCVFIALLFLTGGSIHIVVLIVIEGCLWASIKWFIFELQKTQEQNAAHPEDITEKNK